MHMPGHSCLYRLQQRLKSYSRPLSLFVLPHHRGRLSVRQEASLYALVKEGLFREDLYYRLKVFPINVPPLKSRKEDTPLLTHHFIGQLNHKTGKNIRSVSPAAMQKIMDYHWPGNVRELENAIEHAFVLCNSNTIDLPHLPMEIRAMASQSNHVSTPLSTNTVETSDWGLLHGEDWWTCFINVNGIRQKQPGDLT